MSGLDHFQKFVKRDIEGIFEAATKEIPVSEVEMSEAVNSENTSIVSEPEENRTTTIIKSRNRKRKPVVTEEKIDE